MPKGKQFQRIISFVISFCFLTSYAAFFTGSDKVEASGGYTLSNRNLNIQLSPETGKLVSLMIGGREMLAAGSENGFVVTDVKNDKKYDASGSIQKIGNKLMQSIEIPDSGLTLEISYYVRGAGIFVDGTVKDSTNSDRMITLEYLAPFAAENLLWYDNLDDTAQIVKNRVYSSGRNYVENHFMSTYPFAAVSNGNTALALGIPSDPPLASLESYDYSAGREAMVARFEFALSPMVTALKSKADFSFMLYAPEEPEWGFRSAAEGYYDTFPQYYVNRLDSSGNWLFQHDVSKLEGIEDFSVIIDETPGYEADDANGIYSTLYTAPAEAALLWPESENWPPREEWVHSSVDGILGPSYEAFLERFAVLKKRNTPSDNVPGYTVAEEAEAIENSAIYDSKNEYSLWGWLVYGQNTHFTTNHSPYLPGQNMFKVQFARIQNAIKAAKLFGTELDGVYIDNFSGGSALNYRADHLKYSSLPLLWDKDMRLVMPLMTSTYEYGKAIRNWTLENDMVTIGNVVFPERNAAAKYAYLVDAPGSECGVDNDEWGISPDIMRLRRTVVYQKPWMMLLGNDSGVPSTLKGKEKLLKNSMIYGIFANVMGYRVESSAREQCRYLFRKYTPVTELQDKLGWEPVTYAKFENPANGIVERFGDFSNGSAVFTMYNGSYDESLNERVVIDLNKIGLDQSKWGSLRAYDILNNEGVDLQLDIGKGLVYISKELFPEDATAVMIATEDEIFNYLSEYCYSDFTRISTAVINIPKTINTYREPLPEGYEEFEKAMLKIIKYSDNDALQLKTNAKELVKDIDDATSHITQVYSNMLLTRNTFNNNIVLTTSRIRAKLGGFLNGLPFTEIDEPHTNPPADNQQPAEKQPPAADSPAAAEPANEETAVETVAQAQQTIVKTVVNQIEETPNNTSTVVIICSIIVVVSSLASVVYRFLRSKGLF